MAKEAGVVRLVGPQEAITAAAGKVIETLQVRLHAEFSSSFIDLLTPAGTNFYVSPTSFILSSLLSLQKYAAENATLRIDPGLIPGLIGKGGSQIQALQVRCATSLSLPFYGVT